MSNSLAALLADNSMRNNENEVIFADVFNSSEGWRSVALNISKFAGKDITFKVESHIGGPGGIWCGEWVAVDEFWVGKIN